MEGKVKDTDNRKGRPYVKYGNLSHVKGYGKSRALALQMLIGATSIVVGTALAAVRRDFTSPQVKDTDNR